MSKLKHVSATPVLHIYSPVLDGEALSEFELFIKKIPNWTHPALVKDSQIIGARIKKMLNDCGSPENLFRPEGKMNDDVVALPLLQELRSKKIGVLRLYCDRLSDHILIIGNGGVKKVDQYQDDPLLKSYVETLQKIDKIVKRKLRARDIDIDNVSAVLSILNDITF